MEKPEALCNGGGLVLAECVEMDPRDVEPGEYSRRILIHGVNLRAMYDVDYTRWLVEASEWVKSGGTKERVYKYDWAEGL